MNAVGFLFCLSFHYVQVFHISVSLLSILTNLNNALADSLSLESE